MCCEIFNSQIATTLLQYGFNTLRNKQRTMSRKTSKLSLKTSISRTNSNFIKKVFKFLILMVNLCQEAVPFNLETRLPIIKYGKNPNSYFGYAVAMHIVGEYNWPNNTKWLLVGAPLDKNLQPGTNHSGALYKCPITQDFNDCEQIITDGRRTKEGTYEAPYDGEDETTLSVPFADEIKEGQWLGVTVQSQGLGGKVLVCAHRYVLKVFDNRLGQGLCYVLGNDLKFDEVYEPCKGRSVQRAHEDYAFCQVGTSGALLEDNTMVLGSPGPYTWRGTVFVTEIGGEYLERDKNMYYSDHSDTTSPVDKYSYLGMAVTGGRYFGKRMSYAAGAPRSKGHGQVVIFNKASTIPIPLEMIIDGEQFGSSFGYELTTADVNGDQKPDLMVAAPFYFTKSEGGAVYLFQNTDDKLPLKPTLKLTGTLESRFGLALANIGDINKDNCEDLAVGAPYESSGVVYIFLGSRAGLIEKPAQRIQASDLGLLPKPLNTFGSSIAGGIDLDGNSYPDVLIGAYNSSAAVALLTRPIISIQTSWRSSELTNIDPTKKGCITDSFTNLTCFTFEACCSIDPYEHSTPHKELRLMYTVEAETYDHQRKYSRVFFKQNDSRSNIVKRELNVRTGGKQECGKVTGYIKENTRDIQSPLRFRLNYTIVEPSLPQSGLQGLNPILDQTQSDIEFAGTFQKDCGEDGICESDLILNAELDLNFENGKYVLILGEQEEIRVTVNISNLADSAYETQLIIVHQQNVSYIAAANTNTVNCNLFNKTVVICNLGNPMFRDTNFQIEIRFDPNGLGIEENELEFQIFANTTSKLASTQNPETKLRAHVIKRVDLSLDGWARPEQSFYSGEETKDETIKRLEDAGSHLIHIYQIYNDGPWKAPKVLVNIYWPYKIYNENNLEIKWLLYLESVPVIENLKKGKCIVAPEHVNPLKLNSRHRSFELDVSSKPTSHQDKSIDLRNSTRTQRDTIARVIRPERFVESKDIKVKKREIVELNCNKASASCLKIQCEIEDMPAKYEIYIHVKARLWNSTLVSEYPRVDLVRIISTAYVEIPKEYSVEQLNTNQNVSVETNAYPELFDATGEIATPLWIIILAIIFGILLLALFTYGLWQCGFFKRRRPDPTLSGNLEKFNEGKPFLDTTRSRIMVY